MALKLKVGDKVETPDGLGVIRWIDEGDDSYLVQIKGFDGHSGCAGNVPIELVLELRKTLDAWWFSDSEVTKLEK